MGDELIFTRKIPARTAWTIFVVRFEIPLIIVVSPMKFLPGVFSFGYANRNRIKRCYGFTNSIKKEKDKKKKIKVNYITKVEIPCFISCE